MINRLAAARKAAGLTQAQLAGLSGVHRVSIARYERGLASPNVRSLEKLSNALNVPVGELIGDTKKAG